MMNETFHGSLFTHDFLTQSISDNPDWAQLTDSAIDELAGELQGIFGKFPVTQTPNETRTEDDLIWPILRRLGWTQSMRQQNLTVKGREDVPDGLIFADAAAKASTNLGAPQRLRSETGCC